jgi:hypothetical protein
MKVKYFEDTDTLHIELRTYGSVVRQTSTAVKNLIPVMNGEKPIVQVKGSGRARQGTAFWIAWVGEIEE